MKPYPVPKIEDLRACYPHLTDWHFTDDKTLADCKARFDNLTPFRGAPHE